MKTGDLFRLFRTITLLLAFATLAQTTFAQTRLYDTNLVVVRVGNGVQTLSNQGNPIFLDQFTPAGTYVSSVAIPDTGATAVVLPGNNTNDAFLTRSADGRFLTLAVYATNSQCGINITASTGPRRAVLNIDGLGNLQQPSVTTTDFTQSWRCAATDGTNNYWGVGNTGGIVYLGNASAKAVIENAKLNCRVVQIFNGSLYVSSLSTAVDNVTGIYKFVGRPTTTTPMPAAFIATNTYDGVNKGASDFAVNQFNTRVYFADSRPYDSVAGGIQRWDYDNVNGIWVNTYHLTNGLPGDGLAHIAVDWSGASPIIYATTIGNTVTNRTSIVKVTDNGPSSPFTTLATSGANQVYRGIKFGPVLAAPIIVTQPQDQYTTVGGSANFSVNVTGAAPLTYQWRLNNVNIPGATTSSLTFTNVQLTNAGTYLVIVTNFSGAATSQPAVLTVETSAPVITSLTSNVLAEVGSTAALSVIATSSGPMTYQWLFGNTPINGATGATLSLTNSQFTNSGSYYVNVSDQYGTTQSAPAAVTIFSAPQSTNVLAGASPTFFSQTVGPVQPTFQWRFNGEDIAPATTSSFTINNAQPADAGHYSIVLSEPGTTVISSDAFLQVVSNPTNNAPGAAIAPLGLINWWPFDGSFNDIIGTLNASPVGGVDIAPGEVGFGSYYDAGTTTHVQVGGTPVPPPWTASFWVYRQNTTWNSASVLGDTNTSLKLEQFKTTRKVGFTDFKVADWSFNYICPPATWTHLVWVGTSTNTSLYANGVLQDTVVATINLPRGQIGADFGGNIDHTLGVIDEVMLFNRALNAAEISAIYNAGSAGVLRVPEFVNPSYFGNNQFNTTVRGLTGKTIFLYGSSDLVNWTFLNTVRNTTGTFQFTDTTTSTPGFRFYKATQP